MALDIQEFEEICNTADEYVLALDPNTWGKGNLHYKVGENLQAIPIEIETYDEMAYVRDNVVNKVRTIDWEDSTAIWNKPTIDGELLFNLTKWTKGRFSVKVGAVIFCRCVDGNLFYRTDKSLDWKPVTPKPYESSCDDWIGSHNKMVFAMIHHSEELLRTLAHKSEKFYAEGVGYGTYFDVTYL